MQPTQADLLSLPQQDSCSSIKLKTQKKVKKSKETRYLLQRISSCRRSTSQYCSTAGDFQAWCWPPPCIWRGQHQSLHGSASGCQPPRWPLREEESNQLRNCVSQTWWDDKVVKLKPSQKQPFNFFSCFLLGASNTNSEEQMNLQNLSAYSEDRVKRDLSPPFPALSQS